MPNHDRHERPFDDSNLESVARERPRDDPNRDVIAPGADPVEPRDATTEPVPRRVSKAVLLAIPGLLLVALGIAWMLAKEPVLGGPADSEQVRGTTGERASGHDPEGDGQSNVLNPGPEGPAIITAVEQLTTAEEYAGRPARFAAIAVHAKNGDRTFWVGRLGSRRLVLLDRDAVNADAVQPGKTITLEGRIERTPSSEQLGALGLSKKDRDALEDEPVYIHATKIEPTNGDAGTPVTETPREQRENP